MKAILGVVAVFGWFSHCHDIHFPDHHGEDAGMGDAGAAEDGGRDAGDVDAGISKPCGGEDLGLYADEGCRALADSVRPYEPQFPLWSDGADKERFIYLPPGDQIDASNPDRWNFPLNTRLYKTFSLGGRRVETRVMRKILSAAPGVASWQFLVFKWSESQDSTELILDSTRATEDLGEKDVFEGHDIPGTKECVRCHTMGGLSPTDLTPLFDAVNGFGAIQLNTQFEGVTLQSLIAEGILSNAAPDLEAQAIVPGDGLAPDLTRAALGYLHGNCSACHGLATPALAENPPGSGMPKQGGPAAGLSLIVKVGQPLILQPVYQTGLCKCLASWQGHPVDPTAPLDSVGAKFERRIYAGHAERSGIVGRMARRNGALPTEEDPMPLGYKDQMPPIGTQNVDSAAVETITAWIDAMSGLECSKPEYAACVSTTP